MRVLTGIAIVATVASSGAAFAQQTTTHSLSPGLSVQASPDSGDKGFVWLDRLSVSKDSVRVAPALAPIPSDQLALSWKAGGKWGLTLDFTSRAPNSVLPKEEFAAGAYYQVTPRFRFGGNVTLNGDNLKSAAEGWQDGTKQSEAGVRIEFAFAF